MTKVQSAAVLGIFALLVASACSDSSGPADRAGEDRFGRPYEIVTNVSPAAPDEPPALVADSLQIMVAYPGGCAEHDFSLASTVRGDTADVWLVHDDGGDDCEALIRDDLRIAVPGPVASASRVHLLNPNADVPFIVRWQAPLSE